MNLEETNNELYFKDCFTKVDAGINAEFNKVTAKCIDSTTQKFSVDCDGNLVVNSITTTVPITTNQNITLDIIYPVGSIYMSVNSTNPSTLFGGTWEQIRDRFLLACGSNPNGAMGGEASHTLTIDEMPSHTHSTLDMCSNVTGVTNYVSGWGYEEVRLNKSSWGNLVQNTGGSKAHNNMPPYLAVYIWKRIS